MLNAPRPTAFTIPLPLFPRLVQWYISKEQETSGLTAQTLRAVGSIRSQFLGGPPEGDKQRWDIGASIREVLL